MSAGPLATVLLADDAADLRTLVRRLLLRDGRFEIVAEAGDGAEAIELARSHGPDLVVLDLSMPVLDGLSALPRILEVSPRSRVLVLSGFGSDQMARQATEAGAHAYLEKGAAFVELADRLAALVDRAEGQTG